MNQVHLAPSIHAFLNQLAPIAAELELPLAGQAGSGRKYYRLQFAARSWIIQQSNAGDADFARFVEYCELFAGLGLCTPRIHAVDSTQYQVLLDDLGSMQLWDHCRSSDPEHGTHPHAEECKGLYSRVLGELTHWQAVSVRAFEQCEDLRSRDFDAHALRWETGYFSEHYLQGHCAMPAVHIDSLAPIFDSLAQKVAAHPRGLMHRDFQSQNVMVDREGRIGFVDFQGARRGSLYYDAASLLWDPYVTLSTEMAKEWFDEWVSRNPNLTIHPVDHWCCFLEASLQRLMQALGAYCNLSRNKGIQSFASHIEPGKAHLRDVLHLYAQVPGALDLGILQRWL